MLGIDFGADLALQWNPGAAMVCPSLLHYNNTIRPTAISLSNDDRNRFNVARIRTMTLDDVATETSN